MATNTIPLLASPFSEPVGCVECSHTGMIVVEGEGARRCKCQAAKSRANFLARIPPEFGVPLLNSVQPDLNRYRGQAEKLALFRDRPLDSYFLYGSNGTGKTFFGWMLALNAFEEGRKVIATDLDKLLKQYRKWQFAGAEPVPDEKLRPAVLSDDLEQSTWPFTIFLDEIGGTTPTEYAAKEFFNVLKAAASFGHQMILTCDVSPQELQAFWSREDAHWGRKIARRIADYSKQVDLFRDRK